MFKASVTVGDIVEGAAGDMQPQGGPRRRTEKGRAAESSHHAPTTASPWDDRV